jgi:hypothetical protein
MDVLFTIGGSWSPSAFSRGCSDGHEFAKPRDGNTVPKPPDAS